MAALLVPTDAFDGLRDEARRRVRLSALEGDVLHEVGDARLLAGLAARTRQDIGRHGQGAGARQTGSDHPRPVGQDGALEHRADGTGIGDRLRAIRTESVVRGDVERLDCAPSNGPGAVRIASVWMGPHRRSRAAATRRATHGVRVEAMSRATDADMVVKEDHPMASRRVKLAALLGTFALVASACSTTGGSPSPSGGTADCAGAGTAAAEGAELQIPDIEEGKFNVAMVLIGPHDDSGWSQAHYEGLQYLCENMPDTHVAYVELVLEGAPSEQVFRSLARKGFDFIIGTSFGYMDPMETVATEFPDATFLHLTGYKSNGTNFGNFFGAMEDFKYLAGMLAGSRAKMDGNEKIGYMATFPIPEEVRLGNSIMLGAKQTCPDCTMDIRWIGTWHDPIKEKEGAASLFDAGAQVVFTGADTPAVADVAAEKGKWGVTYDHPNSCKIDACLTAPYWIWGPEYKRIAEQVRDGTYKAGYEYFDADTGAMGLFGFMDGQTAAARDRRPARRGCAAGQGHAGQDAGRRVRPLRRLRRSAQRQHRQGDPRGRREAGAVRPRPVPQRRRRQLPDVHELAGGRHQRDHPGLAVADHAALDRRDDDWARGRRLTSPVHPRSRRMAIDGRYP